MSISPFQIVVVLVLGVLFFGKNLPAVARQIGSALIEFRKGLDEWKEVQARGGKPKVKPAAAEEEPAERFDSLGAKFEPPEEREES